MCGLCAECRTWTIKSGENVAQIAMDTSTMSDEIIKINSLKTNVALTAGKVSRAAACACQNQNHPDGPTVGSTRCIIGPPTSCRTDHALCARVKVLKLPPYPPCCDTKSCNSVVSADVGASMEGFDSFLQMKFRLSGKPLLPLPSTARWAATCAP